MGPSSSELIAMYAEDGVMVVCEFVEQVREIGAESGIEIEGLAPGPVVKYRMVAVAVDDDTQATAGHAVDCSPQFEEATIEQCRVAAIEAALEDLESQIVGLGI